MFGLVPSPRLREQVGRRRIVLEQRQMRRDVFRAPQPRPIRPGQIERADPERTGDDAHEHHAIARKPGQLARVECLLRTRLVTVVQFLRGDAETAQDRPIVRPRPRAMQPTDPETRHIRRDRNAGRAPPLRQSDPATSRRRPPAQAACARPSASCRRQERPCKNPKEGNLKSRRLEVPPIPAVRQSPRWSASSAYSPRPPPAARGPARRVPR